jgi:hypothetical protein
MATHPALQAALCPMDSTCPFWTIYCATDFFIIQVEHLYSKTPQTRMLQNLKLFEYWHYSTGRKFHTWPHGMPQSKSRPTKNTVSNCLHMKHKWISCLDLGPLPKKSLHVYANTPKSLKNRKSKTLLLTSALDKGYSACIELIQTHKVNTVFL